MWQDLIPTDQMLLMILFAYSLNSSHQPALGLKGTIKLEQVIRFNKYRFVSFQQYYPFSIGMFIQ